MEIIGIEGCQRGISKFDDEICTAHDLRELYNKYAVKKHRMTTASDLMTLSFVIVGAAIAVSNKHPDYGTANAVAWGSFSAVKDYLNPRKKRDALRNASLQLGCIVNVSGRYAYFNDNIKNNQEAVRILSEGIVAVVTNLGDAFSGSEPDYASGLKKIVALVPTKAALARAGFTQFQSDPTELYRAEIAVCNGKKVNG